MIVALAGGTGAAKLVRGLTRVTEAARLVVIGNTGDDLEWWGLHVSPDLDSVAYAVAGLLDPVRGWGFRDETFHCVAAMKRFGRETWFQLGDRDLATHLHRTELLRRGASLSEATRAIADSLGIATRLVPMSDDTVRTKIRTPSSWLSLEEFFVRERSEPDVLEVVYGGADAARPAPGVLDAIARAEAVIVCCSNPVTSIGPILAVPGITDALATTRAPVVAVSPIVGTAPVSGPAGKLLRARGLPVAPTTIARIYHPWLDVLVFDRRDAALAADVESHGARPVTAETLMTNETAEATLAATVLDAVGLTA